MRWGAFRGAKRDSKYGNQPTHCSEGIMHHSKKESRRCTELHLMQTGGLIRDLEAHPQPRYDLAVNGVDVARYIPDFRYVEADTGETVVEDVKSPATRTREYVIKSRLMLAIHGIDVKET